MYADLKSPGRWEAFVILRPRVALPQPWSRLSLAATTPPVLVVVSIQHVWATDRQPSNWPCERWQLQRAAFRLSTAIIFAMDWIRCSSEAGPTTDWLTNRRKNSTTSFI